MGRNGPAMSKMQAAAPAATESLADREPQFRRNHRPPKQRAEPLVAPLRPTSQNLLDFLLERVTGPDEEDDVRDEDAPWYL